MRKEVADFNQFLEGLPLELGELPQSHQLAFAAACCERALPNYDRFSKSACWGDPTILRSAVELAWRAVEGEAVPTHQIRRLEQQCREATPNSDSFPGMGATAAQEAAFMATLLLELILEKTSGLAVRVAAFARDTVDMHVQEIENIDPLDPLLEEKIAQHPLTLRELRKQQEDLNWLWEAKDTRDLRGFARRGRFGQVSNIEW